MALGRYPGVRGEIIAMGMVKIALSHKSFGFEVALHALVGLLGPYWLFPRRRLQT